MVISLLMLWMGNLDETITWTGTALIVIFWISFACTVRLAIVRPLRTLSNMQAALREGDYSFRVSGARRGDPLGDLMIEMNTLSDLMREKHLVALEANALLSTVMAEIDVAIFAFDDRECLRLINREGERLLGSHAERTIGSTASALGLQEFLQGQSAQTLDGSFRGKSGRWGVRRSTFRQEGKCHQLLVITDLSRTLREEERQVWQRLVRVLSHELNNSLTPICSIAQSLAEQLKAGPHGPDWESDLQRGLRIIGDRSEALGRFMKDYARLTTLPKPNARPVKIGDLVSRAIALDTRMPVRIEAGADASVDVDPDQIQQLLINLIRNAVDASLETGGGVTVGWTSKGRSANIFVLDEGRGIANTANLFVPFFTTKKGGSGIGLILSRQIAEAHGGSLVVKNRPHGRGCEAMVQLPGA